MITPEQARQPTPNEVEALKNLEAAIDAEILTRPWIHPVSVDIGQPTHRMLLFIIAAYEAAGWRVESTRRDSGWFLTFEQPPDPDDV